MQARVRPPCPRGRCLTGQLLHRSYNHPVRIGQSFHQFPWPKPHFVSEHCCGQHKQQPWQTALRPAACRAAEADANTTVAGITGSSDSIGAGDDAASAEEALTPGQQALNDFLGWLVANGVQGVGTDDSPAALYEEEGSGERGLLAQQALAPGHVVLRVPLRLALTDHAGDKDGDSMTYQGAPWSVRLAMKLLREAVAGPSSPWAAYVAVLPRTVPAPLEAFSWEDMQQVEWPPTQAELYEAHWLATDAYNRIGGLRPGAAGGQGDGSGDTQDPRGVTSEQFQWAMAVVHSRTFANAAAGGGVGVRMLVPLVDMLNHAGDVSASGVPGDATLRPVDNVRWDVVAPDSSPAGCWEMVVTATAPVTQGAPLLLSYGTRPSDDFFVHYGFVPPLCNPHEDAQLFEDIEEALEWHHTRFAHVLLGGEAEAEAAYTSAYHAALDEHRAARRAPSSPPDLPLPKGWEKLKAYGGGKVDGALITAYAAAVAASVVSASGALSPQEAATRAVARRAAQLLAGLPTPLLLDLWLIFKDAAAIGDEETLGVAGWLLSQQAGEQQRYAAALQELLEGEVAIDTVTSSFPVLGSAAGEGPEGGLSPEQVCNELDASALTNRIRLRLPLSSNQRLCVRFRVGKKLVLWGLVAAALEAQWSSESEENVVLPSLPLSRNQRLPPPLL